MHLGRAPLELGPALSDFFQRAELLVLEVDLDEVERMEMLRLSATYAQQPRGETLAQQVSSQTYSALLAWCDREGKRPESYTAFRAWFVSAMVELQGYASRGYLAEYGTEMQLTHLAKKRKMQVTSLESVEQQMKILSSISTEAQDQMLETAVESGDEDFAELLGAWQSGDEEEMERILLREWDDPAARELLEAVVFQRNVNMALQLDQRTLDGRDRFVVVGASHLVGERGIPALLAERGYAVERVGAKPP